MFEKIEILIITFFLLIIFYLVIFLGAKKKKEHSQSEEIKNYMFNVRVLVIFIGVISLFLWFFISPARSTFAAGIPIVLSDLSMAK